MKIIAPNKNYRGISAGVAFNEGVGYTDSPYLIAWFEANGYAVVSESDTVSPPVVSDMISSAEPVIPSAESDIDRIPDLEDLSAEELIQFAKDNDIDIGRATAKETVLKKILEAGGETDGTAEEQG